MTLDAFRTWLSTLAEAQALVPASEVLERLPAENELPAADLTADQVAGLMSRTAACVRGWCRDGRLPGAYRMGDGSREWRIPREALDAYRGSQGRGGGRKEPPAGDLGAWRRELHVEGA